MTLKECYQILGLTQSASLDEVKRMYRRRAFELHPDLNPHLSGASLQFQKLNEAYVILTKLLSAREARDEKKRSAEQTTTSASSAKNTHTEKAEEKTTSASSEKTTDTGTASQRPSGAEQHSHTETTSEQHTTSEKATTEKQTTKQTTESHDTSHATHAASEGRTREQDMGASVYAGQQEVLQDILNDTFARRVFEDIYSEIRKKSPSQEEAASASVRRPAPPKPAPKPVAQPPQTQKPASSGLNWGQGRLSLDFSKGIGAMVKGWLRSQIDEEQTFELPARRLIPGARIRLQIRRGFSDEITTLDVTLPPDFKPDKPIRLRGMGKKLGRWQGDLYLRLSPKV